MAQTSALIAQQYAAAARNKDAWGKAVYNVKDNGAKGSGASDDTSAIQKTINLAYDNGGGIVFFPAGTYMVTGLKIYSRVSLMGVGKIATTIKLMNSSNEHVIRTPDFDSLVGTNPPTDKLVKTGGLYHLTIDGNKDNQSEQKNGLSYLGIDLQMEEVEIKYCSNYGTWIESSSNIFSVTVGQNLQSNIRHIEVHDNENGNFYYNGQSDSTMIDIVCYETGGTGTGQFNFKIGPNAPGLRVFGLHCWGVSDYGIINEGSSAAYTACHVESASVAKVWIKAATYFDGRIYQNGTGPTLPFDAPAFLFGSGIGSCNIRCTISRCKIAVKFSGPDGGNSLFDIQHFSEDASSVLFSGTLSTSNFVRARLIGGVVTSIFQTPNIKQVPGSNWDFSAPGSNYAFWTDEAKTMRQFGIEHTTSADSYLAATGGTTTAGPILQVRGANADYDLRLIPKGAGAVRFGSLTSNSDVPITGYITIKDQNGTLRKLAVIS